MALDQLTARPLKPAKTQGIPEALHIGTEVRPFARDFGAPGVNLQLLQADIEGNTFAVRIRFAPGVQLPPHHHTGVVYAYTISGEWYYLEYSDSPKNRAGSYLFEPPGSIHTLKVSDNNTEVTDVIFIITGAMLILDDKGCVIQVLDAASHIGDWAESLKEQGDPVPEVIGGSTVRYYHPQ
ncbi:2,4'-dihydroxyacetophenone dioxygenase family protein [Pseudomonas sp.]|uniref:2,4'-dihydroxyacetophenone dioxygenase family protein n=1 Tax=Pseudomonas sp. TaxID=306 RepID=UPI0028B18A84|nr:2,4'-dihydroxyacetophenone dioxygenase family protein [Pseudomonas sp.]